MNQRHYNIPLAVAWSVGTLVSMLGMGIAGRELAAELRPHHAAFIRNAICLLLLFPILSIQGWRHTRTAYLGRHIARNSVHFAAQWSWLYGLGVLPLAEVFAIEFSAPLWGALFAVVFLKERLTLSRAMAIALGFAGILVILRPGTALMDPASFVVLTAAVGYAFSYVITKHIVGLESPLTIIWWMNVIQLPIGAVLIVGDVIIPSTAMVPWMLLIGVAGLTSHYCLSQALQYADATVVLPLDFLRLPLGALIGWLWYQETVSNWLALGAVMILLGNTLNLKRSSNT